MINYNIGDKVYLVNFQSETGVIESRIEGTTKYMVRIDKDSLLLEVSCLEMQPVKD